MFFFFLKKKILETWMSIWLLICFWFSRVKFTVEDAEEDEEQGSGLLVELEGKEEKKKRETDLWFSKVCFFVRSAGISLLYTVLFCQQFAGSLLTSDLRVPMLKLIIDSKRIILTNSATVRKGCDFCYVTYKLSIVTSDILSLSLFAV